MPRAKKTTQKEKKSEIKKTRVGLKVPVFALDGKETGSLDLPREIFAVESNQRLLAQYVRVYLANRRQGTAATKTRGEVSGSTRKIYRQKGTGRARHGSIRAPIFVGGGIVGGPKPRDYSLKLNKKQRRKALLYALSLKFKQKSIFGLENKALSMEIKTKTAANFIKAIKSVNQQVLIIIPESDRNNLYLSFKNLTNTSFINANSINAYEVLKSQKIIIVEDALTILKKKLLSSRQTS